jgi:hypothetical protein
MHYNPNHRTSRRAATKTRSEKVVLSSDIFERHPLGKFLSIPENANRFYRMIESRYRFHADAVVQSFYRRLQFHCSEGKIPTVTEGKEWAFIERMTNRMQLDQPRKPAHRNREWVENLDEMGSPYWNDRGDHEVINSLVENEHIDLWWEHFMLLKDLDVTVAALSHCMTQQEIAELTRIHQTTICRSQRKVKESFKRYVRNAYSPFPAAA